MHYLFYFFIILLYFFSIIIIVFSWLVFGSDGSKLKKIGEYIIFQKVFELTFTSNVKTHTIKEMPII